MEHALKDIKLKLVTEKLKYPKIKMVGIKNLDTYKDDDTILENFENRNMLNQDYYIKFIHKFTNQKINSWSLILL